MEINDGERADQQLQQVQDSCPFPAPASEPPHERARASPSPSPSFKDSPADAPAGRKRAWSADTQHPCEPAEATAGWETSDIPLAWNMEAMSALDSITVMDAVDDLARLVLSGPEERYTGSKAAAAEDLKQAYIAGGGKWVPMKLEEPGILRNMQVRGVANQLRSLRDLGVTKHLRKMPYHSIVVNDCDRFITLAKDDTEDTPHEQDSLPLAWDLEATSAMDSITVMDAVDDLARLVLSGPEDRYTGSKAAAAEDLKQAYIAGGGEWVPLKLEEPGILRDMRVRGVANELRSLRDLRVTKHLRGMPYHSLVVNNCDRFVALVKDDTEDTPTSGGDNT